ncbi:hypothetical protein HZA44_02910 [Candidatus Peregrinibacteria bacterium]|nr:hypothetical protein [Candidatus Peregrinibacteria bacterium]
MVSPGIRALAYVVLGVTGEVIYTALKALIQKHDLRLQGYTQLWVMPFYALGGVFIFEKLVLLMGGWNIALRFLVYALVIFGIEYLAGFTAKQITGKCPWEYQGKRNLHGYINLPHLPFWGAVGLIFEFVHRWLISF